MFFFVFNFFSVVSQFCANFSDCFVHSRYSFQRFVLFLDIRMTSSSRGAGADEYQ